MVSCITFHHRIISLSFASIYYPGKHSHLPILGQNSIEDLLEQILTSTSRMSDWEDKVRELLFPTNSEGYWFTVLESWRLYPKMGLFKGKFLSSEKECSPWAFVPVKSLINVHPSLMEVEESNKVQLLRNWHIHDVW